jgi:acetate kinase
VKPTAADGASGPLVLVLNVGSSSLKAALLGVGGSWLRQWHAERELRGEALGDVLEQWLLPQLQPWWPRLQLVGHRVVHGGERLTAPTRLRPPLLAELERLVPLAPLHNRPALDAIRWLAAAEPQLPQWACFDTAFHATLPAEAYSYALPRAWRDQGYRRFGFHGLNHQHVAEVAAAHWRASGRTGLPRLISCHLGAGCSLAAVREGKSIDTTMGFTPMEGLVMASRSGSVDPGLLLHLLRQGIPAEQLDHTLTRASGLKGLSELTGDWRQLRTAAAEGHAGAQLALAVFRHRLLAGIGAMAASLEGVDLIALSAGIGANDPQLAEELQAALGWLGPFELLRIPADEEGVIARECWNGFSRDPADPAFDAAGG